MLTWMAAEISSRPLGLTRTVVGSACVIRSVLAWPILLGLTDSEVVKIPYADWLPAPSTSLVTLIAAIWLLSALLFTLGWRVPVVGPILFAAIAATLALDQQTYDNHVYLMAWLVLLLTVADAGAGLSMRGKDRAVVRWPVLLLMIQLSVVYAFSAITKFNELFLSGSTLAAVLRNGVIPFPDSLRVLPLLSAVAGVVIFVELFIALMIWRPTFRPAAFVLGLGLHASITLLMASTAQLLVFSLEMLALYPLFLHPDPLLLTGPADPAWRRKIHRLDLLRVVRLEGVGDELVLNHHGRTTLAASAHTRIAEHLVPWLWFAPLLRIPGISHIHRRWHRSGGRPRLPADEIQVQ